MTQLSQLTPAETLLVLKDTDAKLNELLKFTFMDLLLKQVLRTFEVERQLNPRDAVRTYTYVEIGNNFKTYRPLPHETLFLEPFQKSDSLQVLFPHMVKIGYQNAKSTAKLHTLIRQSPTINRCFSRTFFQSLFGDFDVTPKGKALRHTIHTEIAHLEKQLPPLITNDRQKALDILRVIKGNVFLLTTIEFDLLHHIDTQLFAEMNKREDHSNAGGCSGCTWASFDSYSESFDSSCSSNSGCSSGDSGCGGGGCGGCGGD